MLTKKYQDDFNILENSIKTKAISFSEFKRGFAQIKLTVTDLRRSRNTKTVSSLLFIRINKPPLVKFQPTKYVNTSLLLGHRSVASTQNKLRKSKADEYEDNL